MRFFRFVTAVLGIGLFASCQASAAVFPAPQSKLGETHLVEPAQFRRGGAVRSRGAVGNRGGYARRGYAGRGPRGAMAGRGFVARGPHGAIAGRGYVARGARGAVAGRGYVARGPRGNIVAGRGAVARPGPYRPGYRPVPVRPWVRPASYWWHPGMAVVSGAAIGFVTAAAANAYVNSQPPAPGYCWYYTNSQRTQGFWDVCP